MKIVTVCDAGAVRSVTLAFVLKKKYRVDALPLSLRYNSQETTKMLFDWADWILISMEEMSNRLMEKMYGDQWWIRAEILQPKLDKIINVDIGEDVWKLSLHPQLINLCVHRLLDQEQKLGLIAHEEWYENTGTVTITGGVDIKRKIK